MYLDRSNTGDRFFLNMQKYFCKRNKINIFRGKPAIQYATFHFCEFIYSTTRLNRISRGRPIYFGSEIVSVLKKA